MLNNQGKDNNIEEEYQQDQDNKEAEEDTETKRTNQQNEQEGDEAEKEPGDAKFEDNSEDNMAPMATKDETSPIGSYWTMTESEWENDTNIRKLTDAKNYPIYSSRIFKVPPTCSLSFIFLQGNCPAKNSTSI